MSPDERDPAPWSVDVVLPVLNEVESIPWILSRMPAHVHAIVVDNGSTDGSAGVASELGAEVVVEPQRGFGSACYAGLVAATAHVVAFMDADCSLDPSELDLVCGPVQRGEADLVLGRRRPERGSWPIHARMANEVLAFHVRRRTGVRLRDLGPMRAAGREDLLGLGIEDRAFGWPLEMVLRAADEGWRITERTVGYRPRVGRSKVTGTVRGTSAAVRDMTRLLRAPR